MGVRNLTHCPINSADRRGKLFYSIFHRDAVNQLIKDYHMKTAGMMLISGRTMFLFFFWFLQIVESFVELPGTWKEIEIAKNLKLLHNIK